MASFTASRLLPRVEKYYSTACIYEAYMMYTVYSVLKIDDFAWPRERLSASPRKEFIRIHSDYLRLVLGLSV
jgi:hypothetical protein